MSDRQPAENLIGDREFGITMELVQKHLQQIQEKLKKINDVIAKEDTPESLKEFANDRKAQIESILEIPPDEIIRFLKEIYDFVCQLEKEGLSKTQILQKIMDKGKDFIQKIETIYGIMRSQSWGYCLFQDLFAYSIRCRKNQC